jgi:hypothetical protein
VTKQRIHNEWFRRVNVRLIKGDKYRDEALIQEILSRPDNTWTEEELRKPYTTIIGEESSRKSCPTCKDKLEDGEWVWSWGEYAYGKWRTVRHFCKHCFPDIARDLAVHREECGCDFELRSRGDVLPSWLTLEERCTA